MPAVPNTPGNPWLVKGILAVLGITAFGAGIWYSSSIQQLASTTQIKWSSTTDPAGTADVGIVRGSSAGVLKVTNGGTAHGVLEAGTDGIATTSTDGVVIANSTATVKGVNQVEQSPRLRFRANVNDTDGAGTNDTHDVWFELGGTAGATSAATLALKSSVNGAAATTIWSIQASTGALSMISSASAGVNTSGSIQSGNPNVGAGTYHMYALDGALCSRRWIGEEITVAAGTSTVESTSNLLPANSCIFGVVYRLKTDGGAIATIDIGPAGNTDAWINDGTCAAAGDTGTWHTNGGDATYVYAGAINAAAAKLTVTFNVNTTANSVVQVYVLYETVTAPSQD